MAHAKKTRTAPRAKKSPAKEHRTAVATEAPSPAFHQRLIATLKRVLPLDLTAPNGLVVMRYELAGEPVFTESGLSARLRLRHFGEGTRTPPAREQDHAERDELEIKRLEARIKALRKGKTDPEALLAAYEALGIVRDRQVKRLVALSKPRESPAPRDGDAEERTEQLFTPSDLQHETRCLDALTRWPIAIQQAFNDAPRPRWDRGFHKLLRRLVARVELDAAYATWKATQPDRTRWASTLHCQPPSW